MPRDLGQAQNLSNDPISLAEFSGRLDDLGCDLADEEGLHQAAVLLARLHANRTFLADFAVEELKRECAGQDGVNRYGAQVLMLHRVPGRHFVRANFWPPLDDPVLAASGAAHYFYHHAHDHNFDFLTVGHFGPGYRSRWFEQDHADVAGWAGEAVALRETEAGVLTPGRMLHYRAHRDVHEQLPPDSLSVSINIVPEDAGAVWRDQYVFDLGARRIAGISTLAASEVLLRVALAAGSPDGRQLAEDFARAHPSDRMRWTAWSALAGAEDSTVGRAAVLDQAARSSSALVRGQAAAMLSVISRRGAGTRNP